MAEALAERILCLPIYPGLAMETMDKIAAAVFERLRRTSGGSGAGQAAHKGRFFGSFVLGKCHVTNWGVYGNLG